MEMDSLLNPPATRSGTADAAAQRGSHPSRRGEVQGRIRELTEERKALLGDDDINRRRAAAVKRHRRRLEGATSQARETHLAVRRSLSVVS